ncbi:hypothetical protein FS749_012769 [Ceratobasidium sp. UAMH 11750]|nr:hypothetical protein FS749_012769 [Ceratobasidium sp. UAMH 11750]
MPLITSYFSVATPEEAAEQATCEFERIRHASRWDKARKAAEDATKSERARQLATDRQRRRRLCLKEAEAQHGLRDRETLQRIKPM